MVKPIPRSLLPDTVVYREKNDDGGFYGGDYKNDVTLSYVRVDELSAHELSQLTDGEKYSHLLFFDAVNSVASAPFEFKVNSQVDFKGQTLTVQKAIPCYTFFGKLHHWEIEVGT
ncbi:putative minor capsid protein [Solibacillus sp. FSL R7-0668]|uniref:putative minor capsid protein n=1 Tax=Solibacillus sp. FSL R7-0668 TaxID=2921688 RepID=UPI0030FCAD6F